MIYSLSMRIKLLAALILFLSVASAEILNVSYPDPHAVIYVDGQAVGVGSVSNYNVALGSHHVRIEKDGLTAYSEIVEVEAGLVKTVNAENFVSIKTTIPNKGAKLAEAARVRESKGNLGVGVLVSPFNSGFSCKYFFSNRWGTQLSLWSESRVNEGFYNENIRGLYVIADTLFDKSPTSVYLFVGASQNGRRSPTSESLEGLLEVGIGVETKFELSSSMPHDLNSTALLPFIYASYLSIEVSIVRYNKNNAPSYEGMCISGGPHYYF